MKEPTPEEVDAMLKTCSAFIQKTIPSDMEFTLFVYRASEDSVDRACATSLDLEGMKLLLQMFLDEDREDGDDNTIPPNTLLN